MKSIQYNSIKNAALGSIIVIVCLLSITPLGLAQGDTWTTKAPIQTARIWFSCEVVNGKIYAIGGGTVSGAPTLATVEEYDPVSDTWMFKQEMPTARRSMFSAVVDGKIYIIGGDRNLIIGQTNGVRTVEVYDPNNNTWDTQKAEMPTAREGGSASAVNGIIYVIGGVKPGGVASNEVEAYDPVTDTWVTKNPMPTARWALSTAVVDGKIYAMGGGQGLTIVEEYDPDTDTWTRIDNMPIGIGYFGNSVFDGNIYTIGGASVEGMTIVSHSKVFLFNPKTNIWKEKKSMPTARFALRCSVVNGKIYAIGGGIGWPFSPLATNEEYTPAITSVETKPMNSPASFVLHQNFPNPFNPDTRIGYEVSKSASVVLRIMNLLGQNVCTLVNEEKPVGCYEVTWDGKDDHGQRVASGVYLYRLESKDFVQTRKMILLQ